MLRRFYLVWAILAFLLTYYYVILFVMENGLDIGLFVSDMFANRPATIVSLDVLATSFILWLFIFSEGRKLKLGYLWVYVLGNLFVGVLFALPLFLYVREGKLDPGRS